MNKITATGTVMWASFKEDKTSLNALVSVRTGQKKKEGEQYAPSIVYAIYLTGNYALLHRGLEKGDAVIISGSMQVPEFEDGKLKPINVSFPEVERTYVPQPEPELMGVSTAKQVDDDIDLGF